MILLEKRAHLILKTPGAVVRRLIVDVSEQRRDVRRADGKKAIAALPRELRHALLLHLGRRTRLDLRDDLRGRPRACQLHRKVNMVGDTANAEAFAIELTRSSRDICVQRGPNLVIDQGLSMFRAENDMHQVEAQRLRHCSDYMSGLQPSHSHDPRIPRPSA